MQQGESILGLLKTQCSFLDMFEDMEQFVDPVREFPRRMVGHICAAYDEGGWWHLWFPYHRELADKAAREEFAGVYNSLISDSAWKNLDVMTRFCQSHPEAWVGPQLRHEYNFYLQGKYCNYWLRLSTDPQKNYNINLHALAR